MRYSSLQITGTGDQPYFYPNDASDSVARYIRREFALAGVLEGGIEMYLEKELSRAALVPETHPLFNCDVKRLTRQRRYLSMMLFIKTHKKKRKISMISKKDAGIVAR
jgi:hypothetical protein